MNFTRIKNYVNLSWKFKLVKTGNLLVKMASVSLYFNVPKAKKLSEKKKLLINTNKSYEIKSTKLDIK